MRKSFVFGLCIAALVMALTVQAAEILSGKVVHIADGDTVTILTGGNRQVKIRLYGIDCPEKRQAYGNRARQAIAEMIAGKEVRVRSMGVDRYGRVLGLITGPGGEDVNRAMIRQGMAWVYTHYCKAPECKRWRIDEVEAQAAKLGLWADPHAMPPWDWRRANRRRR
ncbi:MULTISPECIES: thermonuclease family protein [unclassified Desulfovibrio]|uniref:thermonuclease family protein n=1 Tax=unclassified Desulfovibrio TaxID=2593640 RepID=UPI0013EDB04E|nr:MULTISPECIES: thermonuclease family protein [unclassified Desulfovibrio]